MKHDQQTYELIEAYLNGRLEGEALAGFESALQKNEALQEEVALQRSVHSVLGEEDVEALDAQLTDLRAEYGADQGPKLWPFRKIWFAAAAVFVLAIAYLGFFRTSPNLSDQALYQAYFEPYPADVSSRAGGDSTVVSHMERALMAYEAGRYQEALDMFTLLPFIDTRARFFEAMCQMALEQPQMALNNFQLVINDQNSVYGDPALWYTALAELQLENRENAIQLLTTLGEEASGKYRNLATELLGKLQ